MKKISLILLSMVLLFIASMFSINLGETDLQEVVVNGIILKVGSVALLFFVGFGLLRLRDWMLDTKFPIDLINKDSKAAAFYYGISFFAIILATAMVVS